MIKAIEGTAQCRNNQYPRSSQSNHREDRNRNRKGRNPYPSFGLHSGEQIRLDHCKAYPLQEHKPSRIVIETEFPLYIVARAYYKNDTGERSFRFCINKASLMCGDMRAWRMSTGESLR